MAREVDIGAIIARWRHRCLRLSQNQESWGGVNMAMTPVEIAEIGALCDAAENPRDGTIGSARIGDLISGRVRLTF